MDYLKFFDLDEDPFRFTPDPEFFYRSEGHNEVLLSLDYLVDRKEGFLLVTGESGIGKTLTLKVFIEKYKDENEIALIMTPRLSPEEFFMAVMDAFNVPHDDGKDEIIKTFREFLLSSAAQGKKTVIIVDEAQQLPDETLEELRLLSELGTKKEKLLQIVLIGQSELKARLQQNHLRQLDQRITVRAELHPFTQSETIEYINFRLNRAGKGMTVFDERAKQAIHKMTVGIPRTINLLASRALMSAFIEESRTVVERHVRQAATYVFYSPPGNGPWTIFNPIRKFFGGTVENRPVIVDKNLLNPRPVRPSGSLRPAGVAVIVSVVVGGIYLLGPKTRPVGVVRQAPALSTLIDPRPEKKPVALLPGKLFNLPEFIPRVAKDRAYGANNPGWERYRGKVAEFRVLREKDGMIKGIQVIDRGGAGINEAFMKRALQQVANTTAFKAESAELKEGFKIERGKVGEKLQLVSYRDETGGRLRAFVFTWF